MPRKKSRRGKRYSAAQKNRILKTAQRKNLTAQQVQRQFGVSPLTFYRWRGPVRRRRGAVARANHSAGTGQSGLRAQVREGVRRVLPGVIRQEVSLYLAEIFRGGSGGRRRGPGRPRTRAKK